MKTLGWAELRALVTCGREKNLLGILMSGSRTARDCVQLKGLALVLIEQRGLKNREYLACVEPSDRDFWSALLKLTEVEEVRMFGKR